MAATISDLGDPAAPVWQVWGTTLGGDLIVTDSHPTELYGFHASTFMAADGNNVFYNAGGEDRNSYYLDGGYNTLHLSASNHYVASRSGHNLIQVLGGDQLYVENGSGADVLKIQTTLNKIAVNNWDFTQDVLQFGGKVKLSDVRVVYSEAMTEYQVYIQKALVAVLDADDAHLPAYNAATGNFEGTDVVPFALTNPSASSFISSLYAAAFARAPDGPGLAYWQSALTAGTDRKVVAETFFSSGEYSQTHQTNTAFIDGLYHDVLGRSPDLAGEAYWVSQLNTGATRANVVGSFMHSAEFNQLFF